mmetsp:Transcript_4008/g.7058  ORF Transcript_4008/g.7058 Transcript_4008/m.7058 type:complete len:335 (+) Transcript_4008:260-1264(+)
MTRLLNDPFFPRIGHSNLGGFASAGHVCRITLGGHEVPEAGEQMAVELEPLFMQLIAHIHAESCHFSSCRIVAIRLIHLQGMLIHSRHLLSKVIVDFIKSCLYHWIGVSPTAVRKVRYHILNPEGLCEIELQDRTHMPLRCTESLVRFADFKTRRIHGISGGTAAIIDSEPNQGAQRRRHVGSYLRDKADTGLFNSDVALVDIKLAGPIIVPLVGTNSIGMLEQATCSFVRVLKGRAFVVTCHSVADIVKSHFVLGLDGKRHRMLPIPSHRKFQMPRCKCFICRKGSEDIPDSGFSVSEFSCRLCIVHIAETKMFVIAIVQLQLASKGDHIFSV